MEFSWGDAARVAAIGFAGVYVILAVLMIGVQVIGKIARRFVRPAQEKKD